MPIKESDLYPAVKAFLEAQGYTVKSEIGHLDVLAIGFFAIIVFEVVMGGLRTYLFAHTTNRIVEVRCFE